MVLVHTLPTYIFLTYKSIVSGAREAMLFIHQPLVDASQSIRLFKLLPREREGRLICSMAVYGLDKFPNFFASSYS